MFFEIVYANDIPFSHIYRGHSGMSPWREDEQRERARVRKLQLETPR